MFQTESSLFHYCSHGPGGTQDDLHNRHISYKRFLNECPLHAVNPTHTVIFKLWADKTCLLLSVHTEKIIDHRINKSWVGRTCIIEDGIDDCATSILW